MSAVRRVPSDPARPGPRPAVAAAIALLAGGLLPPEPAAAQDRDELVPVVPAGVPVVVLPVQSARPTPGGAWPGGAPSMEATLRALDAELAFAFGEERGAEAWVMPDEVERRLERNPVVRVDPRRLSYHGLLREPRREEQLYEPLHGQLRSLAALFGSRVVLLPLAVWYEPLPPDAGVRTGGEDRPPPEAGAERSPPESAVGSGAASRGRAVLLMALVDVRRSAVLWHGTLEGAPAEPGSPALLATLAQRVARQLSPS